MSLNNQWDNLQYEVFDFPYNRIEAELSPAQRISDGRNSFITSGGKLTKRPGTLDLIPGQSIPGRVDRVISYETMGDTPFLYLVASVYITADDVWKIYVNPLQSIPTAWYLVPDLRDCNDSIRPHEFAVSGGLVYVKGCPDPASSEKLGSVILDGSGGTVVTRPWGILGPQTPASVNGAITLLTNSINSTTTTIVVDSVSGFLIGPVTFIQVGFETMSLISAVGTTLTVVRGVQGTVATDHSESSTVIQLLWSNSNHPVTVNYGWTYSYAYKSITGQISNRSPLETNPDKLPSSTGPFFDYCPQIRVTGTADTTNIPTICIYRTTDGGGTFYKLAEMDNPGAFTTTFIDNDLESGSSGGTFQDPIPDSVLDTFDLGPSLVSNSPPPAVTSPEVTGVDPVEPYTRIAIYQTRLWYGIGNILFYSAQEELNEGIPEESWPSGSQNGRLGNFFRFQSPITNLQETSEALYVYTADATYRLTGSNRETFSFAPAFQNIGSPSNQAQSITRFNDTVAFLSHDYRVYVMENEKLRAISDPLGSDLVDQISDDTTFSLKYFSDLDKEWLVVSTHNAAAPDASRHWVYDIQKSGIQRPPFWNTPWNINSTASTVTRVTQSSSQRRLLFAIYSPVDDESALVYIDTSGNTGTDSILGASVGFDFRVQFHQMLVPAGNHVNALRQGGINPNVYGVVIDRLQYPADADPEMSWFFDDLWTTPTYPTQSGPPPRRQQSKGYRTIHYSINRVCHHFSLAIEKAASPELLTILRLVVTWEPEGGV